MGTVKSIRFNDRYSRMFLIVKEYCSKQGEITDTQIIMNGIEKLYDEIVEKVDNLFVAEMSKGLKRKDLVELFNKICNGLEILRITDGDTLKDQFWIFLLVNIKEGHVFADDCEKEERYFKDTPYKKILEQIILSESKESNKTEDQIFDMLYEIEDVFEKKFP